MVHCKMMMLIVSCYGDVILKMFYHFYLAGRNVAPEVLRKEEYDTKVDVFSFALIFQEVRMYLFFAPLFSCKALVDCKDR